MSKKLFIAEKPSVAREFARTLGQKMSQHDGYQESPDYVVTWCVGHLVTMSYPEAYDPSLKKWRLSDLPFLPETFRYEVIDSVRKQFQTVSSQLNRSDVDTIYICTDSGREGEYIYRLVDQMAGVHDKKRKRVWIDSQTDEEIRRGIREAKDWSAYDNIASSAYLRAKEDYLMGINFSRLLTLKYGNVLAAFLNQRYAVISVGRVMTCVLGMVVRREREIRAFEKTPFYRVLATLSFNGFSFHAEWKSAEGSRYYQTPALYKENGFRQKKDAQDLIASLRQVKPQEMTVTAITRKKEKKNPPLLYNLAELQNDCSRFFKISPDDTLKVIQELYERKLVTYPRTDARVLSTAVAKVIDKNIRGLLGISGVKQAAQNILERESYKNLAKTRYVNDSQITDHYAIIPTGQGLGSLRSLKGLPVKIYELIVRRFLAIFYPPAVYQKTALTAIMDQETFTAGFKTLLDAGYLPIMEYSFKEKKQEKSENRKSSPQTVKTDSAVEKNRLSGAGDDLQNGKDVPPSEKLAALKKGAKLPVSGFAIKEGETSPPKRYNSGSMILAMENAGQLIEDEQLREQIRSTGIGTSATRAGILTKLVKNRYLQLNKKTQVLTPTLQGELIYDIVESSIRSLLNPELTASWEKGLNYVAEGSITSEEYMDKLENFIRQKTYRVMNTRNSAQMNNLFRKHAVYYRKPEKKGGKSRKKVAE